MTAMDKVFSTRLDEDLGRRVDRFAKERSLSKKALIEKALREYMDRLDPNHELDAIEKSFGAWNRDESPEETWQRGHEQFNKAFFRHQTDSDK
jgi:predicted transcriptional regulator